MVVIKLRNSNVKCNISNTETFQIITKIHVSEVYALMFQRFPEWEALTRWVEL